MRRIIIFMLLAATIVTSSVGLASCNKGSGEDSKPTAASTTGTQSDGDEFNGETSNDNNENNETYELLPSTEGLDFKLAPNGKYYELIGIGTCTATDIFVDSYNGLPVALIGYESF